MVETEGHFYYFDEKSGMATGLKKIGNQLYYFGNNGIRRTGFYRLDEKAYYFGEDEVHRQEFWIRGMDMCTTLKERKELKPV